MEEGGDGGGGRWRRGEMEEGACARGRWRREACMKKMEGRRAHERPPRATGDGGRRKGSGAGDKMAREKGTGWEEEKVGRKWGSRNRTREWSVKPEGGS